MCSCAKCNFPEKICRQQNGKGLADCPTLCNAKEVETALCKYQEGKYKKFSKSAAQQEAAGYEHDADGEAYPTKTRLQETIEFCLRMEYNKIGLAFCLGLQKEAAIVNDILVANGFDVVSVICKVGGICKEDFGLEQKDKINPGEYEVICNPMAQAEICNTKNTDFNIVLGLCVGHDSMFLKNSDALCTVLAVKDRVLAHNPLGAVYTAKTYYKRLNKVNQGVNDNE
jgi:uncharacterized metal-binding protein